MFNHNLTKQQRAQLKSLTQRAAILALREQFTGEGATLRSIFFLRDAVIMSAGWMALFLLVGSWAMIGSLLVGPDHDFFLKQLHSWAVATPIAEVLIRSHEMFVVSVIESALAGLTLGFGQKLLTVVMPAVQQAKGEFVDRLHLVRRLLLLDAPRDTVPTGRKAGTHRSDSQITA